MGEMTPGGSKDHPHQQSVWFCHGDVIPKGIELKQKIKGVEGVNCTMDEVDQDTESVRITIEGPGIDFDKIEATLRESGAVIHSVDSVAAGKKLVEDVRVPQHR